MCCLTRCDSRMESLSRMRRPGMRNVDLFETQQFGRAPGMPADESFEVVDKGTPALNGKAIRKQVTIYLNKEKAGHR